MAPNERPRTFMEIFTEDPIAFGVFVATIIVLVTAVIWWALRRNRGFRQYILLVGLSGSGKTALYSLLVAAKGVESFTSMKENNSALYLKEIKKTVKLVDIPGNDRLRSKFLDKYKHLAKGVIFVVDSLSFFRELKEVAELFYTVAGDRLLVQGRPLFLVLCNKQDEAMSKTAKVIRSQLEKEMNTVRMTRSAQLEATDGPSSGNVFLGKRGKDFEFSDLKPLQVDFVDCSVKDGNVDSIVKWIQRAA